MPQDSQGRYYEGPQASTEFALASAARTTSTTSTPFTVGSDVDSVQATLAITASGGTNPTLDVTLQTSTDGTNYDTAGTFPQKTGTATDASTFGPVAGTCRWAWTIGGTDTPTFTFSISANVNRD